MAGGGLNTNNIDAVISVTGCREFHTTAKSWVESSSTYKPNVKMNGTENIPEYRRLIASLEEVRELSRIIKEKLNGKP